MLHIFGVRHLSPGASRELLALCDRIKPQAVLVEGPSDAMDIMKHLIRPDTVPPVAILAYTETAPVRSFTLPFAVYSPEYCAIRWALTHGAAAEFIDLPSGIFLARQDEKKPPDSPASVDSDTPEAPDSPGDAEAADSTALSALPVKPPQSIYERWAQANGFDDFETSWESTFEHLPSGGYREAALAFGEGMRALEEPNEENLLREAYMRRQIRAAEARGYDNILVVCGAYHAPVLGAEHPAMSSAELDALPRVPVSLTLMPYSYLRLSAKSGYGAGNGSPLYFESLWNRQNDPESIPAAFFSELAAMMRERGLFRSPAEVIEAVMLARGLAALRGSDTPVLFDLRSAAMTVMGQGELSAVAEALMQVETGTAIGSLPQDIGRTSIQDDFYRQLKALRLERYRSAVAMDLSLDLRESHGSADIARSAFLHRLDVLSIGFAVPQQSRQAKASWKEVWSLRWTPEAEIMLVEASLRGETVEMAAAHALTERVEKAAGIAEIAEAIHRALLCDLPAFFGAACAELQGRAVEAEGFEDMVKAVNSLSRILAYGSLRPVREDVIWPMLSQLFLHAALQLTEQCRCNPQQAAVLQGHIHILHQAYLEHGGRLPAEYWERALREVALRDDLAPLLSGFCCALLLEMAQLTEDTLETEVSRRLSPGIPADLGAGWFEGLAARNHYALLSRQVLWRSLDGYIALLEQEAFMRALVFLRRAFSTFSVQEKRMVFENLSECWQLNAELTEDALSAELTQEEEESLQALSDFDFDDF